MKPVPHFVNSALIKAMRLSNGLSPEQFAVKLGISLSSVTHIENNGDQGFNPSAYTMAKIAKYFSVDMDELFIFANVKLEK